jgi:carbon-monoxide dehydrogenase medium subunit
MGHRQWPRVPAAVAAGDHPMNEAPDWLAPTSLDEAFHLRAELGDEATVVAGGTYLGILMNQGFLVPSALLSLRNVPGLSYIHADGELRLGAMTTHRTIEQSDTVRRRWPALADTFALVASPRVRNQATVGGLLADADYASDPPAMLTALGARVLLRRQEGERELPLEDFIVGYYETALAPDELLLEVRVPARYNNAVYRKYRSRSTEDRPCVAVAVASDGDVLRVVVGAVTDRPQHFPDICALAAGRSIDSTLARAIGDEYAARIDPISDARGSSTYRKRVIAVEVRRALERLAGVDNA